jgi:ABC-type tungstate transport system permease subunit
MVNSDDPVLRRPCLVAVANPSKIADAHVMEAKRLATFLCGDDTQRWIGEFGKGKLDERSLYAPLTNSNKQNGG